MQLGGKLRINNSRSKKVIFVAILILVLVGAGVLIWKFYPQNLANQNPESLAQARVDVDETEVTEEDKGNHEVPTKHPRYISVPALGVDRARVVNIGLVPGSNQLDSPISIFDAGWYNQSETPGSGTGALLLDGHNGGPSKGGIFDTLGDLEIGSEIIVERGDGEQFTYKVVSNQQMTLDEINDPSNPDGMSTALESAEVGKQGLNIITCVGNWLPDQYTFDQRVMLRAVLL